MHNLLNEFILVKGFGLKFLLIFLGYLLNENLFAKDIFITRQENFSSCNDCIVFNDVLVGLVYSFQNSDNFSLSLIDEEYNLTQRGYDSTNTLALISNSNPNEKFKTVNILGINISRNGKFFRPTINLFEDIYSFSLSNMELKISNINMIISKRIVKKGELICLICFLDKRNLISKFSLDQVSISVLDITTLSRADDQLTTFIFSDSRNFSIYMNQTFIKFSEQEVFRNFLWVLSNLDEENIDNSRTVTITYSSFEGIGFKSSMLFNISKSDLEFNKVNFKNFIIFQMVSLLSKIIISECLFSLNYSEILSNNATFFLRAIQSKLSFFSSAFSGIDISSKTLSNLVNYSFFHCIEQNEIIMRSISVLSLFIKEV
jgi:hypothetical protein